MKVWYGVNGGGTYGVERSVSQSKKARTSCEHCSRRVHVMSMHGHIWYGARVAKKTRVTDARMKTTESDTASERMMHMLRFSFFVLMRASRSALRTASPIPSFMLVHNA